MKGIFDRKILKPEVAFKHLLCRKKVHYMEKNIANCFHLDAIEKIFPDALFIHLVRDGRACVSSMIEGWKIFVKVGVDLPFPEDSTVCHWSYAIPPGWQNVAQKPLEEICAWSWVEHNRYVLEKRDGSQIFSSKYLQLSYEDLLANPMKVIQQVSEFTGIKISKDCLNYVDQNNISWTTISAPKPDKWKEKNPEVINKIMPIISPMMNQLNYKNFSS